MLDPGPDIVIFDEGHKIKNITAEISMTLGAIRTKRRIVLTGYPLQNNLMEYYCMIDFEMDAASVSASKRCYPWSDDVCILQEGKKYCLRKSSREEMEEMEKLKRGCSLLDQMVPVGVLLVVVCIIIIIMWKKMKKPKKPALILI